MCCRKCPLVFLVFQLSNELIEANKLKFTSHKNIFSSPLENAVRKSVYQDKSKIKSHKCCSDIFFDSLIDLALDKNESLKLCDGDVLRNADQRSCSTCFPATNASKGGYEVIYEASPQVAPGRLCIKIVLLLLLFSLELFSRSFKKNIICSF